MRVFPNEFGVNCALVPSPTKPGTYYADPTVLVALIRSEGFNQMSVRVDSQFGVSISLGKRTKGQGKKPEGVADA